MDEDLIKRLDVSLDIITQGFHFFKVGDFVIGKSRDSGRIKVLGFTKHLAFSSIKNTELKPEFESIKLFFLELYEQSEKFKYGISKNDIDYFLQWDYGMGSITLCQEIKGVFEVVVVR